MKNKLICTLLVLFLFSFAGIAYMQFLKEAQPVEVKDNGASSNSQNPIVVADKLYIPAGKELAIYHENVVIGYENYRGRTSITILPGGKETGRATKIKPSLEQIGTTISGVVTIANSTFETEFSKPFSIIVTNPSNNAAANVQHIGDSFTNGMFFVRVLKSTSTLKNLTFSGNRSGRFSRKTVRSEGQGGWTMTAFHTVDYRGYLSPFMQPEKPGYLYYGKTDFWIDANKKSPSYNAKLFEETKKKFDPYTGRKITPETGDVMGDKGGYILWNGSSWASIAASVFGGFSFSYGKYRQAWNIPAPDILHVMLGTNDFFHATESDFQSKYFDYKKKFDILIASAKADTPSVKVIIGIPISSGREGEWGTLKTEGAKHAYQLLAHRLNADYGKREAENIYVLDYHSSLDRVYGFKNEYEPPFADYSGLPVKKDHKVDVSHPSMDGHKQMGNAYMGLIQLLRGANANAGLVKQ